MGVKGVISSAASALSVWKQRHSKRPAQDVLQDDPRRPLLRPDTPRILASQYPRAYGTLEAQLPGDTSEGAQGAESPLRRVPGDMDEDDEDSQDEEEEEEWELEQEGLYKGSYRRIVGFYTFVPLSSLMTFLLLALIPPLALPIKSPRTPHSRYFHMPLPEALAAAGLWSLSHHLRLPIYSVFSLLPSSIAATILSTIFHVLIHNVLRLSTLVILDVRHHMDHPMPTWRDWAFRRVWWIALGWCFAEAVVGIAQGYEQIALYKAVLVPEGEVKEVLRDGSGIGMANGKRASSIGGDIGEMSPRTITAHAVLSGNEASTSAIPGVGSPAQEGFRPLEDSAILLQVDRDLDHLIALNEREKIEEIYGAPFIKIPVFVSCLQRISSIILSMGLTLVLSSSYLRSPLSRRANTIIHRSYPSNHNFFGAFLIVLVIHTFLSMLHTPLILPRIGVHTAAYVGLLVGLGCFFAGLGMWEALS